jgi:hypothetical protein
MEQADKNELPPEKTLVVASDESVSAEPEPKEQAPRAPGILDVLVQGVALFSDGYNIQIIGYMNTVLAKLYVDRASCWKPHSREQVPKGDDT